MTDAHGVARDQLRAFIERIERLSEEAKTIADDIRDVKSEAKAMGFSVKAINEIIKLRKKDDQERMEEEAILDTYKMALGMISDFGEREPEPERINPRLAKQVVDGMQTEAGRAALIAAVDIMIDREEADEGEAAGNASDLPVNSPSDDDAIAAVNRKAGLANVADVEPSSSAPHSPSVDTPDANTGECPDDQVAQPQYAATHQAGASFKAPATFSLRPDCRNPGETCAGHGTTLCHSCKVAMREREVA
jgi:uncharacterized protein (UPF0335 family)